MRISPMLATVVVATTLVACAGDAGTAPTDDAALRSPVGTFTLSTVNGTTVPMLWDQMELWKGGPMLKAYWNGGSVQFRPDSTFTVVFRHSITGPNLPGNVQQDTHTGTWRLMPDARIELRPTGGGVQYWLTTDLIYTVTHTASVPSINGKDETVVFVFLRQ